MAEKDVQNGVIILLIATFFLFSGLRMLNFQLFEPEMSTLLAFILVAVGIYLITRK
jgi:hypothetical protein